MNDAPMYPRKEMTLHSSGTLPVRFILDLSYSTGVWTRRPPRIHVDIPPNASARVQIFCISATFPTGLQLTHTPFVQKLHSEFYYAPTKEALLHELQITNGYFHQVYRLSIPFHSFVH